MKTTFHSLQIFALILVVSSSCMDYDDEGPIQYKEEYYSISDFDRIDIQDALVTEVKRGDYFSIKVRGDRRNLNDLELRKSGNTLMVQFKEWETRQHTTYIEITMPELQAASFSGASNGKLTGFYQLNQFLLTLSGAAIVEADVDAETCNINLSGASVLHISGNARQVVSSVSGASSLKASDLLTEETSITISGASVAKVWATLKLQGNLSGSSLVTYKGNPSIESSITDSSVLRKE